MQINFMLILSNFDGASGRRAKRGVLRLFGVAPVRSAKSRADKVFWGVPFRYVCVRSRGISRLRSARSPRWRVFWDSRVRLVLFLMQGISRLTLEMTACSYCFIMLICKYGHRRLAHRGSLSGGRGRPPLHNLSQVSTGFADLPTAARRRADEERDEERPYLMRLPLGGKLSRSD